MTQLAIDINNKRGQNTYIVDLDIEKAYDSCNRADVRENLRTFGVREKVISMWELLNDRPMTVL